MNTYNKLTILVYPLYIVYNDRLQDYHETFNSSKNIRET